jgi:hypothetical protein
MAPYRLGYEPADEPDGAYVLPSGRILQIQQAVVAATYGTRVKIRVEVTDVRNATASDERWVLAVEDLSRPAEVAGAEPAE